MRYYIYRIRYRIPNTRYRMYDVRYRIRYLQNSRYRRFLLLVLAIFVYDVVYDIVRHIVVFAEIVYDMYFSHRYYTISHGHIVYNVAIIRYRMHISTKTYADTVRCRIQYRDLRCDVRYCLPGAAFAAAMPLERPQVLPYDPRPSRMVCTASSQS